MIGNNICCFLLVKKHASCCNTIREDEGGGTAKIGSYNGGACRRCRRNICAAKSKGFRSVETQGKIVVGIICPYGDGLGHTGCLRRSAADGQICWHIVHHTQGAGSYILQTSRGEQDVHILSFPVIEAGKCCHTTRGCCGQVSKQADRSGAAGGSRNDCCIVRNHEVSINIPDFNNWLRAEGNACNGFGGAVCRLGGDGQVVCNIVIHCHFQIKTV